VGVGKTIVFGFFCILLFFFFFQKRRMWSSTISTSVSPRELLENCFLSHSFNQKYHSRCGHVSVEIVAPERVDETHWRLRSIFIVSMVAESTPAMLRSIIGGLDAQVQQETLVEFGGDPLRLHATATSKIASGPGARLNSSAEWDLTGGEVKLLTSVKYQSSGFAERLIASSLEQAASGKARESIELWWVLAQEAVAASRVVASPRQLGNVQRALSFGSELVENRDIGENHSEDDDVMSSVGDEFVDASSMLESPSLRSSSGLLELLQSEAQNLKVEVEALEQRRDQLFEFFCSVFFFFFCFFLTTKQKGKIGQLRCVLRM
jgi:hypothetical protein